MRRVDELTRKDILNAVDKKNKARSKLIKKVQYLGVTSDYTVYMGVSSVTANPPTTYLVKIKLLEYPSIEDDETLTIREKVRLALAGDVAISCSCPAFLWWGYDYIVSQLSSKVGPEQTIYPHIRNPKLTGILCKHSYRAITHVGMNWTSIAKDIKNRKFISGGV